MQRERQAVQCGRHGEFERRGTKGKRSWRGKQGPDCTQAFGAFSRSLLFLKSNGKPLRKRPNQDLSACQVDDGSVEQGGMWKARCNIVGRDPDARCWGTEVNQKVVGEVIRGWAFLRRPTD